MILVRFLTKIIVYLPRPLYYKSINVTEGMGMKKLLKKIGKNAALVLAGAVVAGSGAAVGVFAAIPHSTSGIISACYTNTTGALRVIDSQASAACENDETALSWSSATTDKNTALMHITPDPNDEASFILDTAKSRNIIAATTINQDGTRYFCAKVAFQPLIKIVQTDDSMMGGGAPVDIRIPKPGSDLANGVEALCGAGYNIISFLNGSAVYEQSVFFSH